LPLQPSVSRACVPLAPRAGACPVWSGPRADGRGGRDPSRRAAYRLGRVGGKLLICSREAIAPPLRTACAVLFGGRSRKHITLVARWWLFSFCLTIPGPQSARPNKVDRAWRRKIDGDTTANERNAQCLFDSRRTHLARIHRIAYIEKRVGADLLVTDQKCRRAWSVQVKTKSGRQKYWHLNKAARDLSSKSHVYVFVALNGTNRPDYLVIVSNKVVVSINKYKSNNYLWHTFKEPAKKSKIEGWKIFGSPEYIG
jgi:hypothetical protein